MWTRDLQFSNPSIYCKRAGIVFLEGNVDVLQCMCPWYSVWRMLYPSATSRPSSHSQNSLQHLYSNPAQTAQLSCALCETRRRTNRLFQRIVPLQQNIFHIGALATSRSTSFSFSHTTFQRIECPAIWRPLLPILFCAQTFSVVLLHPKTKLKLNSMV
jgi:hypothetical protein